MLGNRQDFGLRKGLQWLRRKHEGRRKTMGRLVHQGLEQRQRKVQIFKISESQALAFNKGLYWRFREAHFFMLRKDSLLSFGDFHYFRLRERHHHRGLSKRQDVFWKDRVRDWPSVGID